MLPHMAAPTALPQIPSLAMLRQACLSGLAAPPARSGSSPHPIAAAWHNHLPGAACRSRAAGNNGSSSAVCCMRTDRGSRQRRDERQADAQPEADPQATYACFDSVGGSATIHVFGLNHLEVGSSSIRA